MMLIVDDREKWTHKGSRDVHLKNYFDRHGIMYRVERLNVGDYMLDGGKISVDRKYGLEELSKNLTNREDNERFMAEIRRAYEAGVKLVFLVEQHGISSRNDVAAWRSDITGVSGTRLLKEMFRLEMAYGIRFFFCDKRSCGRRIMEILTTGQ
jgi:ERCC4-type nuclease